MDAGKTGGPSLKERRKRICEIDEELHRLFEERRKLAWGGLDDEQRHKLYEMVMSDHKPHFS